MSSFQFMKAEAERWSAWLPTGHQATEPYTPQEYQQDWNYAPEQQFLGGYNQQPTFNAPRGFAQQPQLSNVHDSDLENLLQQLLQAQANHASEMTKQFAEMKNLLDCCNNKIETINSRPQYLENEEDCIPPQETAMEEAPPSDIHLPFKQNYAVFTEDSDIQEGEGCALHDQAEKQKLEVKLDHPTQPTDRVKLSVMQPPKISNLNLPISNTPTALSNDIGEVIEKNAQTKDELLLEAEECIKEFELLLGCTVDENLVIRYEEQVKPVAIMISSTKSNGEAVGVVGKTFEDPCEGVMVVERIVDKHLGIASTYEVSIAEPRKILFEEIRMKEFRGWFYDEYDPGDTWTHLIR